MDSERLERGTSEHYRDPLLYDLEYADQRDDLDWYCDLADARGPNEDILELGAGSGRITIPLATSGHRVIALDRMAPMLDHLETKLRQLPPLEGEVEVRLGDMTCIPLADATVGMVFAPFNCLMHLYTWEELLTCFREVYRVLEPGGTFAFDVLLPDIEWLMWDPEIRHALTPFVHPRTRQRLLYSTNHRYDYATQVCHIKIYYDEDHRDHPGELRPDTPPLDVVHLAHRQIFPEEARLLVATAGFQLESHSGDFLDLTLDARVEVQALICHKPA